jgi:hypothetical protein
VEGKLDTHEIGTTTTELEAQELGMAKVAGTKTNDEVGTVEIK